MAITTESGFEYWEKPPPTPPKGPTLGDIWAMEHPEYMTDEYLRGLWSDYASELEAFLNLHPGYRKVMPIKSLAVWIQSYLRTHPDYVPTPTPGPEEEAERGGAVMPPRPDIGPGSKRPTPEMEDLYYRYHPEARGTFVTSAEIYDWYQHQRQYPVMPPRPERPTFEWPKPMPTGKLPTFERPQITLSDYPRPPQPSIPTPKPEYPTPGRPVKPRTPFENIFAWRKKKPVWW